MDGPPRRANISGTVVDDTGRYKGGQTRLEVMKQPR